MRLKIIAGNLVALLLVGLGSYFVVRAQLSSRLEADVDAEIANDGVLFDRSWRLSGREFLERVVAQSMTQQVRDAFGGLDDDSRRRRAHEASNAVAEWFRSSGQVREGAPDVVLVTDETGRVLARNQDPNRMVGHALGAELGAVRDVLADGVPRHDAWAYRAEDKVLEVGIAPIRNAQGGIIGALVVAYDLSNGIAQSEGRLLGRDVAFVTADKVYSGSMSQDVKAALQAFLFGERAGQTRAVLESATVDRWAARLGGADFVGVTGRLPLSPSTPVGYVVLANKTAAMDLAGSTASILLFLIVGVIITVAYGFFVGGAWVRALEEIEEGVLAVINGKTETRIALEGGELGGLAYRINQLINVFTGVSESDEGGEGGGTAWRDAPFAEGGAGGGTAPAAVGSSSAPSSAEPIDDPAVAAKLAAEPEDAYYARLYREYVAAKQAAGENVAGIPQDRFVARIRGNAEALAKKHGVAAVRFQVESAGGQVSLRPVLIRQ